MLIVHLAREIWLWKFWKAHVAKMPKREYICDHARNHSRKCQKIFPIDEVNSEDTNAIAVV